MQINRPFLSCPKPLFQGQAKCKAIGMKIILIQSYFDTTKKKGFPSNLVLKVGVFGTPKWPIPTRFKGLSRFVSRSFPEERAIFPPHPRDSLAVCLSA